MSSLYSLNETKDAESFFHGYAADFDNLFAHTKKRSVWDKFLDVTLRMSMKERCELCLEYSTNSSINSILDIGCGGGVYCEAFLKQGK